MKNDPFDLSAARDLRKNMTPQERHLWYDFLRNHPMKFYKQKQVGPFFLDFYCPARKLAIELDGSQHYEDIGKEQDLKRTEYLSRKQIRVLRFSNAEIDRNFEGVCTAIDLAVTGPLSVSLTADSSPHRGEP